MQSASADGRRLACGPRRRGDARGLPLAWAGPSGGGDGAADLPLCAGCPLLPSDSQQLALRPPALSYTAPSSCKQGPPLPTELPLPSPSSRSRVPAFRPDPVRVLPAMDDSPPPMPGSSTPPPAQGRDSKDGSRDQQWRFAQCFGDKGEVEDITEGPSLSLPPPLL
jgi:hypothetical protein